MRVKHITKSVRVGPLAANPDAVPKHPELLDGNLDREDRGGISLRATAGRRDADITQTALVFAPKVLGRGSQAPIHSSTDDG